MTAASAGSAVQAACLAACEKLFYYARGLDASPLANASLEHVTFADGRISLEHVQCSPIQSGIHGWAEACESSVASRRRRGWRRHTARICGIG